MDWKWGNFRKSSVWVVVRINPFFVEKSKAISIPQYHHIFVMTVALPHRMKIGIYRVTPNILHYTSSVKFRIHTEISHLSAICILLFYLHNLHYPLTHKNVRITQELSGCRKPNKPAARNICISTDELAFDELYMWRGQHQTGCERGFYMCASRRQRITQKHQISILAPQKYAWNFPR